MSIESDLELVMKYQKEIKLFEGSFEQWYREMNFVSPGKIRIEADEVHYGLHIILRFETEMDLIGGKLEAKDLPHVWNEKMKKYFGVTPEDDKEGVMQDVHWSEGLFGYFPTYALGSIYSAQLYNQMNKEIPGIESQIESGDFSKVRGWLREKVHSQGRRYLADDLVKRICGEGLNVNTYLSYLNDKYSEIYDLK